MSNAARVLDLDAFRRRREASRGASSAVPAVPAAPSSGLVGSESPAVGWSAGAAPVAWAPFYVWMPVLMVLG